MAHVIGVISDTHGLMRPEALAALQGAELILHAGDIGGREILDALERIAPVIAVRGNNDGAAWAKDIPDSVQVERHGVRIFMLHDVKTLPSGAAADVDVVVAGHSHRPVLERREGVLHLNPGSAGPRRFSLPVAVARLVIDEGAIDAGIVELDVPPTKRKGRV